LLRVFFFFLLFIGFNTLYANPKYERLISSIDLTDEFVQCFDFGCKSQLSLSFNQEQWQAIRLIFKKPALSAWLEKQQIRQAVALMETFSGQLSGTDKDKAGNYPGEDIPQQQDCIDESTNTMQYLNALDKRQLLHWHKSNGKKRRIRFIWTHWTAVISQLDSGEHFAVDSWYRDNGQLPYIQKLSDWQRRSSFPELLNP
jgi:hypothetical protein